MPQFLEYLNKGEGWTLRPDMQGPEDGPGFAELCGGNTQGSGAHGSDTEPLNNFIDRFCSLQLTGHTTPVLLTAATMEDLQRLTGYLITR